MVKGQAEQKYLRAESAVQFYIDATGHHGDTDGKAALLRQFLLEHRKEY